MKKENKKVLSMAKKFIDTKVNRRQTNENLGLSKMVEKLVDVR